MKKLTAMLAMLLCLTCGLCGCGEVPQTGTSENTSASSSKAENDASTDESSSDSSKEESSETADDSSEAPKNDASEAQSESSTADETTESTYEHNENYDIIETATFSNSIGYTIVVHKVLAKKNATVSGTLLVFGADGDVLGKSTDEITLTEGETNFFRYSFENDITGADIQTSFKAEKDSILTGERDAVKMTKYNASGDDLYITFEQTADKIGSFAKFKILFYKGDQIVDTEDGYFSVYAENLTEKGATDVAEIWAYGIDFDSIEYIYEP